ncbi:hypothetical protein Tco_0144889 [Tanacetum coccineum]
MSILSLIITELPRIYGKRDSILNERLPTLTMPGKVNQQTYLAEFPQIDSGLAVLVFKQGDDPIDAINKMMSFLSTVVTSRFPTTNNQLRNSSNPRQQALFMRSHGKTVPKAKEEKLDAAMLRSDVHLRENEITSDSNIIPYSQYLLETQNVAVQDTNSSAQQDV